MKRFNVCLSDLLSFLQPASPASSIRRHVATRLGTATTTRLILSHSHSGTPNSSHAESRQLHYLDDSILEVFPQSKDTAKYGIMQGLQARGKKQEWSLEPCQPHPKKMAKDNGPSHWLSTCPLLYANQVRINVERCTISTFLT